MFVLARPNFFLPALACIFIMLCGPTECSEALGTTRVSEEEFGEFYDEDTNEMHVVTRFTMESEAGMKVQVLNYGVTINSLYVRDKDGKQVDVALGWDDMDGYLSLRGGNPYFGATIGRVSNRIANARFELDGVVYQLQANDGVNHLHGGFRGFDKRIWAHTVQDKGVTFTYESPDGEEGYPGAVSAEIKFEVTASNELHLTYRATTTKPTPVALTNHNYFNLNGHKAAGEKLNGHFVELNADQYTPVDETLIPTGEMKDVEDSVYDLRTRQSLYNRLQSFPAGPNGYDINFCVNKEPGKDMNFAGRIQSEESGISMEVHSDQPGLQFYTGDQLPDPANSEAPLPGKDGAKYSKHGGFCMETQNYPDAINQLNFPSAVLNPGEVYRHAAIYKFTTFTPSAGSALSAQSASLIIGAVLFLVFY